MQNINDFAQTTANIPALSNNPVSLNEPYDVSVALRFLAQRFANKSIKLVNTIRADYDTFMTLNIPAEHLENFQNQSGFDNFDDTDFFMPLEKNTYALYTDFAELNANLE
jgi:putative salt-induced outer membrane protein YdiY